MVAPVVGPIILNSTIPFGNISRRKYKQAFPVDRPLPYTYSMAYGKDDYYADGFPDEHIKNASFAADSDPIYGRMRPSCYNQAYESLRSRLGESAGWAENIAQISKTRRTVVDRATQLASFCSALRRADFRRAAKALRTPIPSGVSNRKAAAQNYLEWEYGVKPVMSDLQNSMKQLVSHPGDITYLRGSSTYSDKRVLYSRLYSPVGRGWTTSVETVNVSGGITIRTGVRITNPNLFLANQLGLIDLALPWKLIPFSFIVDWFVNVEQVISSCTDWYGVQLLHPHYSEVVRGNYLYEYSTYGTDPVTGKIINAGRRHFDRNSVRFDRVLGIPGPSLSVKPFKGFSLQRGAQAIALVVSVLGK